MSQLGRYTLLEKIGGNLFAAVYKAQDTVSGATLALKVLQLGLLDDVSDAEMDARLQREFENAMRLRHPGIARVFEVRRDGSTALIAMELVDGPTVTSLAERRARTDVSQIVTATVQILEALDFAHAQSVVHENLRPSNVLVSQGMRTKITDFGMAKLRARNRDDTGMLVGQTEYMAPEQFPGRSVDGRCDIHAVGTILYELLTGKSPFGGDVGAFAAMTKVLNFTPPPPSTVSPGLSSAFDHVVGRALAKSPADRFATARHFREELCAAHFGLTGRQPPDTLVPIPRSQPSDPEIVATPQQRSAGLPPEPLDVVGPASKRDPKPGVGGSPSADERPDPVLTPVGPPIFKQGIPLTDASVAHGARVLARFVGPIAMVLSRKAAQDAHDERGYFELLAAHLSDPKERAHFFRDIDR